MLSEPNCKPQSDAPQTERIAHTGLFELATRLERQIVLPQRENHQIRYHPLLASVLERIVCVNLDELIGGTVEEYRIPTKCRGPQERANLDDGMPWLLKTPPDESCQSLLLSLLVDPRIGLWALALLIDRHL